MKTSQLLRRSAQETYTRSITKAITYRIVIIISIFTISFLTTRRLADATTITGITAISGTIIYYVHERIWSRIEWGTK
ncbi:MAG: DUF2061 domain-containing protein [Candidatus Saccharibacteria bacterium]